MLTQSKYSKTSYNLLGKRITLQIMIQPQGGPITIGEKIHSPLRLEKSGTVKEKRGQTKGC